MNWSLYYKKKATAVSSGDFLFRYVKWKGCDLRIKNRNKNVVFGLLLLTRCISVYFIYESKKSWNNASEISSVQRRSLQSMSLRPEKSILFRPQVIFWNSFEDCDLKSLED